MLHPKENVLLDLETSSVLEVGDALISLLHYEEISGDTHRKF